MEDKFKIIITDDNGQVSMDVIYKNDWVTVKESDVPGSDGLSIFNLSKIIVSYLKRELQKANDNKKVNPDPEALKKGADSFQPLDS